MAPPAPLALIVQPGPKPTPPTLPPPPPIKDDARESLTNPDWRWRSFDKTENDTRYPLEQKRINASRKGPFEVMYLKRKPQVPWPEAVHIVLFSRPLIQILEEYLPNFWNLKSLAIPVIAGRELYFVLDSLKQHKSQVGGETQVQPAAADQIVDGAPTSSEAIGKDEESPKVQSSSAEEGAPEQTEAQGWASQPATANPNQIADTASMPAVANQVVDGGPTSSEEVGKDEDSPKIQSSSTEERAPELTEAQDSASQRATANEIADGGAGSDDSDAVGSNEVTPKAQNLSVEERAPKHTQAQDGDFQPAVANQIEDGAAMKHGVHSEEDSPKPQSLSVEEKSTKQTEAQGADVQPAAANQIANGAYMRSEGVRSNAGSPYQDVQPPAPDQSADGAVANGEGVHDNEDKDKAPKHIEVQTVTNEIFHEDALIGTGKPVIEDKATESCDSTANQRIEDRVPKDEASRSDEITKSSDSRAFPVLTDEEIGLRHLKHLVRCLQEEYEDIPETVRRIRETKRVVWDMLWAVLPRGAKVVYSCDTSKEICCARVSECYYEALGSRTEIFTVRLDVWDYDGKCYRKCRKVRDISKYRGEKPFSDLAVYPAKMMEIPQRSTEKYLNRGKLFHELVVKSTRRFMHYTGTMFYKSPSGPTTTLSKEKADGRVMIDLASFAEVHPFYPMSNARPPTPATLSSRSQCCEDESHAVSNDSLFASPAIVYGFSFALEKWGAFILTGLTEITFNKSAFDGLTMAQDKKTMVYKLVSQYASQSDGVSEFDSASTSESPELGQQVDLTTQQSSSEGCVFLCYGDSGSGKSLVAESIAESLERPLWDVNVNNLITAPIAKVEKDFKMSLKIAVRWKAILLLNDADVFLTRRARDSAVAAAFLRILEYNPGVMFLGTSQIERIEEAFRTRISVFLHFKGLSGDERQKLWRTLLKADAVKGVTDGLCSELATPDFSGREIRNVLRTARLWAKSEGEPIAAKHVRYVMEMQKKSLDSVNPKPHIYT